MQADLTRARDNNIGRPRHQERGESLLDFRRLHTSTQATRHTEGVLTLLTIGFFSKADWLAYFGTGRQWLAKLLLLPGAYDGNLQGCLSKDKSNQLD
jgi:uncharacterized membrane protein